MNNAALVGNLTRDPELKTTPNGIPVCTFSIAVQRRFKNADGEYEADFIQCVAWRGTAEFIAKHFKKGNKIGLIGSLQSRSYTPDDGIKRYVVEVVVDSCEFVTPKQERNDPTPPPLDMPVGMVGLDDEDLPF